MHHSPEEFVAKAVEAGHQHGMSQCIPDALVEAIRKNRELSAAKRAEYRTEKVKQWIQRASELAPKEKELKAAMHSDVKAILASKRIKLWDKLLVEANYPDLGVVQEFVQGTSLVGEVEQCGLWPRKFSPALATEAELLETSERDKSAVRARVSESCSPTTDKEVWDKTMDEVAMGWLKGPLQPHELPDHCPLSRSFVQGPQVRCVDEYTRSSVNLAVQVSESPKPHPIDLLSSAMVEAMTNCNGGEPWVISTFDLRDAYRQGAVSPASSKFAHIAVKNPSSGEALIFRMLALPFGSIKSVHSSFLRVAHSVWFILVAHLGLISINYFDDFVVLGRKNEPKHVTHIVNTVLRWLGWSFAETGPKAPEFAAAAQALGVRVKYASW